ncbi:MAG: hypothetical protein OXR72_16295 [Gemmatimonadota bacterium]|nr:hypothetical protein [Gemmatimonadota bacterium]
MENSEEIYTVEEIASASYFGVISIIQVLDAATKVQIAEQLRNHMGQLPLHSDGSEEEEKRFLTLLTGLVLLAQPE